MTTTEFKQKFPQYKNLEGNRTWVKRLDKDVEFEVPPVKIKNGKIEL